MGRRGSYQKAERYGDRVRLYAPTKPWRVVVKDSPPEMMAERSFDDGVTHTVDEVAQPVDKDLWWPRTRDGCGYGRGTTCVTTRPCTCSTGRTSRCPTRPRCWATARRR